jgi:hypothetical protein
MFSFRFRIRTIMIAIAVTAALMGLLRGSQPIFFVLMSLIVYLCFPVLILFLAFVGPIALLAVCDWLIRLVSRRFPRGQSLIPETRTGPKRGAEGPVD